MANLKDKNINKDAIKSMSKSAFLKGHSKYDNAEEMYIKYNPEKKDKKEDK